MGQLGDALRAQHLAQRPTNKILILDTERLDGISEQHWWDRGDLKNRYIHYETVTRQPRVTIFAFKDYWAETATVWCEWDRGGRRQFLRKIHKILSDADIVVGHNLDNADIPWLRNDLYVEAGLPSLPPFKTVDTLKVLRRVFKKQGLPFKGLDAACQVLGLPGKTDKYDQEAMERAVAGNTEDRERLASYCQGDVLAGQWLYDWTRPYNPQHPALFVDGEDSLKTCNRCGSVDYRVSPKRYVANVLTYTMLVCNDCGGYRRLSIEPERMSIIRGV